MLHLATQPSAESTQYAVYIYHKNESDKTLPKWERVSATHNMRRAIKHAKLLHRKHVYEKIEIQKRFFCKQTRRVIGKTFKIYK